MKTVLISKIKAFNIKSSTAGFPNGTMKVSCSGIADSQMQRLVKAWKEGGASILAAFRFHQEAIPSENVEARDEACEFKLDIAGAGMKPDGDGNPTLELKFNLGGVDAAMVTDILRVWLAGQSQCEIAIQPSKEQMELPMEEMAPTAPGNVTFFGTLDDDEEQDDEGPSEEPEDPPEEGQF